MALPRGGRLGQGKTALARCPLLLALAGAGCDRGDETPPKSRVQAVLADRESTQLAPSAEPTPPAPAAAAPKPPRPALCHGQLDEKAAVFKPKALPQRMSLDATRELDRDPLERERGRWTWVNFWAAWCVPCKEELPILFRWQKALEGKVRFRFVSLDDDERQLRDFLSRERADGLTSTYWLPDGASRQAWLGALKLTSEPELPLQLLIDPEGKLRCRVQGAVEPDDLATLQAIVNG
jgi:thiol-disulfide isomerase/thioredoxin